MVLELFHSGLGLLAFLTAALLGERLLLALLLGKKSLTVWFVQQIGDPVV